MVMEQFHVLIMVRLHEFTRVMKLTELHTPTQMGYVKLAKSVDGANINFLVLYRMLLLRETKCM